MYAHITRNHSKIRNLLSWEYSVYSCLLSRKKCKYRPKRLIGWELLSFEQDMSGPPRDERYRIEEMNVWQEEGRFSKWGWWDTSSLVTLLATTIWYFSVLCGCDDPSKTHSLTHSLTQSINQLVYQSINYWLVFNNPTVRQSNNLWFNRKKRKDSKADNLHDFSKCQKVDWLILASMCKFL